MTVSYTGDVANGSSFGCFWKILGRWRGSVYKLIWRELIAYLFLYFVINAMYRLGMTEDQRRNFEKVKVYCSKQIESIPMSFVLGFYVSLIVKRWWDQYWILPMPDSLALYISTALHGQDERGRLYRRTIMRYAMLAYIICLQRISFRVKKRFPTLQHLVESGLMTESEKKIFDLMDQKTKVLKFWMPVVWASNLINKARFENRIQSDHMVQTIVTELSDFRRKLGRVMVYDTVSVPLVYTQVVTLAVYTYFVAALIGRQWVNPPDPSTIYPNYELDLYFPIFLSLQFIFYIGWLKVAETLINPFGEDDDDFELNWLIDRHIKVSYMVVDEMHEEHPELLKDQYWDQVVPKDLPYNIASENFRRHEPQGSTAGLKVKPSESVYADLTSVKRHSVIPDEVYADYESVTDSPLPDARKSWIQRQWSRVGSLRSTSSSSSRNRAHSHGHGPLPMSLPHHSSGHRPSLYERILSRRSSKENRNSNRYIPNRALNGTLTIAKEGNSTLMPNPNSRPRVPTPDVAKENPMTLSNNGFENVPNRALYSNENPTGVQTATNTGYGAPPTTVTQNGHVVTTLAGSASPNLPTAQSTNVSAGPPPNPNANREMLPPPYDAMLESRTSATPSPIAGSILSPIAENDGSPYSTSSTTRSSRSSNYPTTTSIFGIGRKPSPPPLDELPPIPTQNAVQSGSSNNSSMKSEEHISLGNINRTPKQRQRHSRQLHHSSNGGMEDGNKNDLTPSAVIHELEAVLKETVMDGRMNEGFIQDEEEIEDNSRDYMTIAEVSESKAEFQRRMRKKEEPPEVIPPSLPHPRPVSGGNFILAKQTQTPEYLPSTSKSSSSGSSSKGSGGGGSKGSRKSSNSSSQNSPPLKEQDLEDDDGYDEKGSYNEDEEFTSVVTSGGSGGGNTPGAGLLVLAPPIHPRGGSYDKSTSATSPVTAQDVGNSKNLSSEDGSMPPSDNNSTGSADNETFLLISPKRRKKPRDNNKDGDKASDRSSSLNGGKSGTSGPTPSSSGKGSGGDQQKPIGVSKDCEVFV